MDINIYRQQCLVYGCVGGGASWPLWRRFALDGSQEVPRIVVSAHAPSSGKSWWSSLFEGSASQKSSWGERIGGGGNRVYSPKSERQGVVMRTWQKTVVVPVAKMLVSDGRLSLNGANIISSINADKDLVVDVDASQLSVKQLRDYGKNGTAPADMRGSDWFVYGHVTLEKAEGKVFLANDRYDFEMHDAKAYSPEWMGHARNAETIGGEMVGRMIGSGGVLPLTPFSIHFVGQPAVSR